MPRNSFKAVIRALAAGSMKPSRSRTAASIRFLVCVHHRRIPSASFGSRPIRGTARAIHPWPIPPAFLHQAMLQDGCERRGFAQLRADFLVATRRDHDQLCADFDAAPDGVVVAVLQACKAMSASVRGSFAEAISPEIKFSPSA